MNDRHNSVFWATIIRSLMALVIGILTSVQVSLAQVRPNDYKGIGSVTFYGIVYNGTKVIAADRGYQAYMELFSATNDYYANHEDELAKDIKKRFKLDLAGCDYTFANKRNSDIDELSLFSYKNHSESGNYQVVQTKLNAMRIPTGSGYGMVIFSYRIDNADKEYKYDIVFFNRQSMKVIAHANSECERTAKNKEEEFVLSVSDAIRSYDYN